MTDVTYIRINGGVETEYGEGYVHVKEGDKLTTVWNEFWLEKLRDYVGYFRILLEEDISQAVGETGWFVFLKQVSPYNVSFMVEISVNHLDKYQVIAKVIQERMPTEFNLSFYLIPRNFDENGIPL